MALSFPIAKVNKEKRTVSGFASLDNVDRHGDIVTADASKKAFENFRGNIREMHGPSAVGKMIDFKEDAFFDKATGKKYSGVYVTAYISKGAQDAWEKVLDGTYSGFSIGGNIVDAKMEKADGGDEPLELKPQQAADARMDGNRERDTQRNLNAPDKQGGGRNPKGEGKKVE